MVTYLTLAVYFLTLTIDSTSPTLAINTVEFPDENINAAMSQRKFSDTFAMVSRIGYSSFIMIKIFL